MATVLKDMCKRS